MHQQGKMVGATQLQSIRTDLLCTNGKDLIQSGRFRLK